VPNRKKALEIERRLQPDVDFEAIFGELTDIEALGVISVSHFLGLLFSHSPILIPCPSFTFSAARLLFKY
jgi:hypothetical protein